MGQVVYLTGHHRLAESGSDEAASRWRRDLRISEADGLQLHHLYRAMGWLGEVKKVVEAAPETLQLL